MTSRHRRGDVRLRSNVVLAGDQRGAQPRSLDAGSRGDRRSSTSRTLLAMRGANRRQRAESGYYLACSRCRRLAHEIGRDGCDDPRCTARPSEASVAAARARHEDALALIAAEREHLDAESVETEREDLSVLLDPESAVARFLGLEVIAHAGESPAEIGAQPSEEKTPAPVVVDLAMHALVEAAARTGRFDRSYCGAPLDNIVDTLSLGQARAALAQLGGGDGGELAPQPSGSPKFCAAYSSSALAVNTFGPWLHRPQELVLAGHSDFDDLAFEVKFPTGLQGKPPNLDVVAVSPDVLVAVESKCIEYLGTHEATFQSSYDAAVGELAHESWRSLFEDLKADAFLLPHLGVGQLMRHYLGLRRAIVSGTASAAKLLYLYWEPRDGSDFDELAAHRRDLARMAERVADPSVEFAAMSYPGLWAQWAALDSPEWLAIHLAALRERYAVSLAAT